MDILKLTALELGEKIRKKEIAVREAVDAVLARAEAAEPVINSYVTLDREGAYRQAEEIQRKIDSGEPAGPLAGVPAAVKDNMCIRGQLTTCSSRRSAKSLAHRGSFLQCVCVELRMKQRV